MRYTAFVSLAHICECRAPFLLYDDRRLLALHWAMTFEQRPHCERRAHSMPLRAVPHRRPAHITSAFKLLN